MKSISNEKFEFIVYSNSNRVGEIAHLMKASAVQTG